MAEEKKEEGTDLTSILEDSHKELKTLVLGGFITDDSGTRLQEGYDEGTTLAIEMEEQTREIGTWPDFPNQPERRYKIKDNKKNTPEGKDAAEKLYYGVNRRSSSIDEKTEEIDKIVYDIAQINKYKLEWDPEGVFGLDGRTKDPEAKPYGDGHLFQSHYENLKSVVNKETDLQPIKDAGKLPQSVPLGMKMGVLPSSPAASPFKLASTGTILNTNEKLNTPLRQSVVVTQVPRTDSSLRASGKVNGKDVPMQIIRHGFDGVVVTEKIINKFPLGIPDIQYVGDALIQQGKQGVELTKLINEYMMIGMFAPDHALVNKFLDSNDIPHEPEDFIEHQFTVAPPNSKDDADITYMHFIENVDIGNEIYLEPGIDMDTVDNMRSQSSFLIMQAEQTLAVKYVDLNHVGLNQMLRNLINDTSLAKLENVKNLSINKFEGKPTNPGEFRINSDTIEMLAKRFEKVTISNSLVTIDLPPQGSITTSNLTLEHCVIVGNNSTINVKGDLNLLDCTFESAKDDKKHFITFKVDGNVDASELIFKEDISIMIGTDSPDKEMNVRNVKYKANSVKEYSNLFISGFKDLKVTGLIREKGATPNAPMITINGCNVILLMDIDNKDASFTTLVEVEAFNDLTIMNVKCAPNEKFNTIVNISKSGEEGKIKLADFDVKGVEGGFLYRITGCTLSTLKFDALKCVAGDTGVLFNNEIETVSFSDCDLHLNKPIDLFFDSQKLTFSSTQIVAPKIKIPVPTAVHLDDAMIRADDEIEVIVKGSSRFSLMKSSLVTKKLVIKREEGVSGDSFELTDSSLGGEGSKTAVIDIDKVVMELSYIMTAETIIKNAGTVDINDTVVRVNTAKILRFENDPNIKNASFDLENGGSLSVITVDSKGKLAFKVKSDVAMRRESRNSITVDTHTVDGENKYRVTVVSTNCLSSAYIVDKKYFNASLEGRDFRFFKSIDTVKLYSPQQSLNGKFKNIHFGLLPEKEDETG